jgi:hypothetical protein
VSAQHRDLVTKYEDLDVLGYVGAGEQRKPAQYAGEYQVREKLLWIVKRPAAGCSVAFSGVCFLRG